MGVEKASYGLKYAIRWHPGTSLASGHVVDTTRILHKRQKKRLFFKKNSAKILLFAKFAVPLHRVKKYYLGLRIGCIPLTLVGITDCGSNPHMHTIYNYF